MRCTARASNGPNHLGLCALQDDRRANSELMAKLRKADYKLPGGLSPELVDLFSALIQPAVPKRLTAKAALQHAWTLGADWSAESVEQMHGATPRNSKSAHPFPRNNQADVYLGVLCTCQRA